jgi:hypothetical protein
MIRCARPVSATMNMTRRPSLHATRSSVGSVASLPDLDARPVPLRVVGVRKGRLLALSRLCATKAVRDESRAVSTVRQTAAERQSADSPERAEMRQSCRISAAVRHWRRAAAFLCASSGLLHAARVLRCGPACSVLRRRRHPTSRCGNPHTQSLIEGALVGARTFLAELHAAQRSTLRPASAESPLD